MATLEEAKANVGQAREQITQIKNLLSEKRQEASQVTQQLQQKEQELPQTNQQSLRLRFSGLVGRQQRQKITKTRGAIQSNILGVKQYEGQLQEYEEKTLKPYEQQVAGAESQIAAYERDVQARATAMKFYHKRIPVAFVKGLEGKYLKELYRNERFAKESFWSNYEKLKLEAPSEKFLIQYKNGMPYISGVESGAFGMSMSVPSYNKQIDEINAISSNSNVLTASSGSFKLPDGSLNPRTINVNIPNNLLNNQSNNIQQTSMNLAPQYINQTTGRQNLWTANPQDVRKAYTDYEKLTTQIQDLSKGNVQNNTWVGSEADYQKYNQLYLKYENLPQYKAGIGSWTKDVDISELRYISQAGTPVGLFGGTMELASQTGSGVLGTLGSKLPEKGLYTTEAYNTTIYTPVFGTIQTDALGKPITSITQNITIPSRDMFTSSQGRAVGEFVGYTTPYLNPYGGYLFAGTALSKYGTEVSDLGLKSGSWEYIKRNPVEIVLLSAGAVSRGVKVARTPQIEFIKIKSPVASLQASESVAYDFGKNVIFPRQTSATFGMSGQRTQINTRWRSWFGLEPVYKGVPYGSNAGNYQRALKLLQEAGYTEQGARNILRYKAPRIIEQELKSGIIKIKNNKAFAEFQYRTYQPVKVTDDLLGIKTRGAKTIQDYYNIDRLAVGNKNMEFGIEFKTGITSLEKGGKLYSFKDLDFSKSFLLGRRLGGGEAWEYGTWKGIRQFSKAPAQRIEMYSFERSQTKGTRFIDLSRSQTLLIKKELPEQSGVKVIQGGGKKSSQEYFEQLYSPSVVISPPKLKPKPQPKTTNQIMDIETPTPVGFSKPESKYAGLGMYERTEETLSPLSRSSSQTLTPDLTNIKVDTLSKVEVASSTKTDTSLSKAFKSVGKLDTSIKTIQEVGLSPKSITKSKVSPKTALSLKQVQQQAQKQAIKQALRSSQRSRSGINPPFKPTFVLKPKSSKPTRELLEKLKKDKNLFKVFGKRFGKDIKIGEFEDIEGARSKLKSFLKGSLGRSGFVTSGGKKLPFEKVGLGGLEFRPAKRDMKRIVQKAKYSLGTGSERSEIQAFRRKRKRKFF